jgi:signal transduction histidine kinase
VQVFGIESLRYDGSSFFCSLNMSRLVLDGNDVVLAMVEDVTDQIAAEQEGAVLNERARLARELHDAVTQTLFSASLLADTTPLIWEIDQAIARQNLNQLGLLLRGALAEMRTLLFELRPIAMRNQTLGQLLDPLIEVVRARTQANAHLTVKGDRILPEDVTAALFRIAQEALNNVTRHSQATEVKLNLACNPKEVVLCITDNGRGFDAATIPPGHLGLGIMAERAQKIGAMFEIESSHDHGTEVVVTWFDQGEIL